MRSPNYPAGTRPFIPLFRRLSGSNAAVLAVASIILLVAPANGGRLVLVAGLAALLVIDLLLMRRAFGPLSKPATLIAQVDPLRPSARLEIERRDSARRAWVAQEEEGRRPAAERHDEIGQSLTALALPLNRLAERSSDGMRAPAVSARDAASQRTEVRLRPAGHGTLR